MSNEFRISAGELAADDHTGICKACGFPAHVGPAGYCEPCLTLAFAAQDEKSTAAGRKAAKIALLCRASWQAEFRSHLNRMMKSYLTRWRMTENFSRYLGRYGG